MAFASQTPGEPTGLCLGFETNRYAHYCSLLVGRRLNFGSVEKDIMVFSLAFHHCDQNKNNLNEEKFILGSQSQRSLNP